MAIASELYAWMEIDGRLLNIGFECKNDDCNEFGKRMIHTLRTLRLKRKSGPGFQGDQALSEGERMITFIGTDEGRVDFQ